MHIAILVTNTDDSAFAARHPRDGEKFETLIRALRPAWQLTAFDLPSGEFPADLTAYDGFIIGGSPASVNEDAPWIARLLSAVPKIVALGRPLFGACFGHQAIAVALGGKVTDNPGGWVFGVTETLVTNPLPWMAPGPVRLNAAHSEQVTVVPAGAKVLGGNADCPAGFLAWGGRVLTTQYHPEITHDFMTALVEEYARKVPPDVATKAFQSLALPADLARMAGWIIGFFEQSTSG
jgi:GMP synthase-like glutamine amidotransferase